MINRHMDSPDTFHVTRIIQNVSWAVNETSVTGKSFVPWTLACEKR